MVWIYQLTKLYAPAVNRTRITTATTWSTNHYTTEALTVLYAKQLYISLAHICRFHGLGIYSCLFWITRAKVVATPVVATPVVATSVM